MAGIHRQGSKHRKNFLLKITMRPCRAFCREFRHFAHVNPVLRQLGQEFIFPQRTLSPDKFANRFPDAIERVRGT